MLGTWFDKKQIISSLCTRTAPYTFNSTNSVSIQISISILHPWEVRDEHLIHSIPRIRFQLIYVNLNFPALGRSWWAPDTLSTRTSATTILQLWATTTSPSPFHIWDQVAKIIKMRRRRNMMAMTRNLTTMTSMTTTVNQYYWCHPGPASAPPARLTARPTTSHNQLHSR